MKDIYPAYSSVPAGWLVPVEDQPDYPERPDSAVGGTLNLTEALVDRHVREGRGDRVAIHLADDGSLYTYADLSRASARLAHALQELGVGPGDRVAVRTPNRPEALIAFLAAWRLGAISVLVPAAARRDELRFFLNDTLVKVLVVANTSASLDELDALGRSDIASVEHVIAYPDAAGTEHLSWEALIEGQPESFDPVPHPADAVGVIWHTGGTTGVPKACYHTARRLLLAAECTVAGYDVSDDDVHMFPAPIGHAAGWLSRATFSLVAGITFVELEDFSNPETVLRAVGDYGVTWLLAMGTTWAQMLPVLENDPAAYDLSSLRRTYAPFITSNGQWLHEAWRKHGLDLLNPVGSTAFAAWFFIPPHDGRTPPLSIWAPTDGWIARVVTPYTSPLEDVPPGEIGQLAVRGVTGLTYWNRPELQSRDVREGWTVTDDLVRVDADGHYWYMGRSDMMITPGGHKVAPVEVEQALSAHEAVAEVAVTAAPDAKLGQTVMAWVVLTPGTEPDEALRVELQRFVKDRLAPYKYPRQIVFLERLPRDPLGKIVMKTLAGWADTGEFPAGSRVR
ncbi:2-aminobenzoate-CoA ligase [Blastococcus aggregatus]|uniref:2-aminobenzoate-CoA ligase n=1 Tax=Blastococcus aggregatus TaxID=38502 RepID=A0A285V342_9ACTN|nr:acyl-CoA synthetase [Blastococcus aggregatus]SOC48554.1 2-aminobenzoate-CoA ligase [Blastococcus aggregatus]